MVTSDDISARILIADDQPDVIGTLCLPLKFEGYVIEVVKSPAADLKAAEANDQALALIAPA